MIKVEIIELLNRDQISSYIKSFKMKNSALEQYSYIMKRVYEVEVNKDQEFQRLFNYFYRIRRREDWRSKYYCLFERCKQQKDLNFSFILRELHKETGWVEASFSSKMLATLNPDMPIWDRNVIENLEIRSVSSSNKQVQIQKTIQAYEDIQEWYKSFLDNDGEKWITAFDEAFPEYTAISSVKKVDFLLWGGKVE